MNIHLPRFNGSGRLLTIIVLIFCTGCEILSRDDPDDPPPEQPQQVSPRVYLTRAIENLDAGQNYAAKVNLQRALQRQPNMRRAQLFLDQLRTQPYALCGKNSSLFQYKVRLNQRLSDIAKTCFGNSDLFLALAKCNGIRVPSQLEVGTTIKVPSRLKIGNQTTKPRQTCGNIEAQLNDLFDQKRYTELLSLADKQPESRVTQPRINSLIFKSHLALMMNAFKNDEFSALNNMRAAQFRAGQDPMMQAALANARQEAATHYLQLAATLKNQGKLKASIDNLRTALEFNQDDTEANQLLMTTSRSLKQHLVEQGDIAMRREDPKQALVFFREAFELEPGDTALQTKIDRLYDLLQ